jgi:hypothetical protein
VYTYGVCVCMYVGRCTVSVCTFDVSVFMSV